MHACFRHSMMVVLPHPLVPTMRVRGLEKTMTAGDGGLVGASAKDGAAERGVTCGAAMEVGHKELERMSLRRNAKKRSSGVPLSRAPWR